MNLISHALTMHTLQNGETALIVAAQNGDLGIVEILIDADASVNQQRNVS